MDNYDKIVDKYLDFCSSQKRLNLKTIRAYSTDLKQFGNSISSVEFTELSGEVLEDYLRSLHRQYKPRSVKRKIASIKTSYPLIEVLPYFIQPPSSALLKC